MALDANVAGSFRTAPISLTVTTGTNAKIVVDCQPASGSLQGGCRVIGGSISSTDSVAKSLLIYEAECLTTQDNTNTGAMALTTSTITRATGSFILDGWTAGDAVMLFGPTTARNVGSATQANTGNLAVITAVTATTLTVNGTPFTADAALPAGARLFRVGLRTRRAIAANAGNADATPAVALLGGTQDPATAALPDAGWELGQTNALVVAVVAAISALPARVDVLAEVANR